MIGSFGNNDSRVSVRVDLGNNAGSRAWTRKLFLRVYGPGTSREMTANWIFSRLRGTNRRQNAGGGWGLAMQTMGGNDHDSFPFNPVDMASV